MVFMEWTDELSVGSSKIDAQHKVLIKFINDLEDAIHKHQAEVVLKEILNGLVEYTILHFDLEEHQLAMCDYPDLAAHKAEHEDLKKSVLGFKEQYESGNLKLDVKILAFLKVWLIDHIMLTDKNYSDYLLSSPST